MVNSYFQRNINHTLACAHVVQPQYYENEDPEFQTLVQVFGDMLGRVPTLTELNNLRIDYELKKGK